MVYVLGRVRKGPAMEESWSGQEGWRLFMSDHGILFPCRAVTRLRCFFCVFLGEAAPDRDEPQFPCSKVQQEHLRRCLDPLDVVVKLQ